MTRMLARLEARCEAPRRPADTHMNLCVIYCELGQHEAAMQHARAARPSSAARRPMPAADMVGLAREEASALAESIAMLDMTHNNAVGYADLMAVRLSNNRRAPGAPPSPLDGWSKAEND